MIFVAKSHQKDFCCALEKVPGAQNGQKNWEKMINQYFSAFWSPLVDSKESEKKQLYVIDRKFSQE